MLKSLNALANPRDALGAAEKVAIIDVGSNSFRLIVITYLPGYYFQVTDEVRETVRLVHGIGQTGRLSRPAMDHAVEVMRLYRAFCDAQNITDIVAVATSAVRDAQNQAEFLARCETEAGMKVRVLSGEEEAYYGFLAAVNSTTLKDGFVIDLGGGSLEITRVENRRSIRGISLALGAVRMTEDWLSDAPTPNSAVERLREHIHEQLRPLRWFKAQPDTQIVGQGGSLRNAARIIQKAHAYPMDELHGYTFGSADLRRRLVRKMQSLSVAERKQISGMKPDRADIALAGAVVVEECLRFSGYSELMVCSQGVREGLFYERFLRDLPEPRFKDVRAASVMNIAHLYHYHESHAAHVAHLALSMFDQVTQLTADGLMGKTERHLLWAASMLHDIGMSIDYNDHHRHSYYLILNSGLPGYSHRELALIALAALYHRKGTPSLQGLDRTLSENDNQRLLKITACLRLAEQLDRSRDGAVRDIRLSKRSERMIQMRVESEVDVAVSKWSAQQHADIFEAAFGYTLEINSHA